MDYGGIDGGIMFTIVPIIVGCGFVFVIAVIIAFLIKGAKQYKRNNDSPVLTVEATMVTKRTNVSHTHSAAGADGFDHSSSSTSYYATFQVQSGDRLEFAIGAQEYGMLVEHDAGRLTFQGTRYLGFERSR